MKLYLNTCPGPALYLEIPDQPELTLKSLEAPELYLDLDKANPHREPVKGQFMATEGAVKSHTEDLSGIVNDLMGDKDDKDHEQA